MNEKNPIRGLLSGIRILDLADEKASFCSRILADLGACVIKVEKPGGDPSRKIGPFTDNLPQSLRSLSFYHNNLNKFGITLDIDQEKGRSLFLHMVEETDIVVETFPHGYLESIGLSFDNFQAVNPKLILVSVSGFGNTGPKSRYKSCNLVASATGGQMYVNGSPETPPLEIFGEQSHVSTSLFGAVGILIALQKRALYGEGSHLDLSMQESVAATLEHVFVRYFSEGIIAERRGGRHWDDAFYIFPCKNGFMHMTLFHQWETLIEWLDSEGMAADLKDPKWKNETFRKENVNAVIEVLCRWTKTHTIEEMFELAQLMQFPWAPVLSPREVTEGSHLADRHFFHPVRTPETGSMTLTPGMPYKFNTQFEPALKSAPMPGEDNLEIYQNELGLSAEEIKRLQSLGVI
ncbi:MAG: CoA transferase [Pseudomonadota bacterium]